MPSMKVKGQTRKEAFDLTRSMTSSRHQTLLKITRDLTRTNSIQPSTVKDEHGKLITKLEDHYKRCANHFRTILNRPDPERPEYIEGKGKEIEIKKGPITCLEIEKAIAKSKNNRAPGEDRITTDMLKADPSMSAKCLVGLFNKVWTEEKVPDAWKKGILIKLPKKGDLSQCNNWRGINLLSVPGNKFCRVILYRIKSNVDKALREEQEGFHEGNLGHSHKQSIEWTSSIYVNFVGFEKGF
ncbi:RNA-directed DNA polymerase from mobile element jockey [Elysia marginata]|uniref:RNA-directed DNA polymerase from mobile element jockey n=1 Tax=Elysia marginata TaxID=1093978 RepID=A0AAV4GMW1_9GAST|nr:RNA-directed DNA polymerase from mobile element jockey [Elysia marginata]